MRKACLLALLVSLAALPAAATVIDTFPYWDEDVTSDWLFTAQTITAPADNVLDSYSFGVSARAEDGLIGFGVYLWGVDSPVGPALYSATAAWTTSSSIISFTSINLALATGVQYGMVVDTLGYDDESVQFLGDAYSGGNAFFSFDGTNWQGHPEFDHRFRAEFVPGVPDPGIVPEPGTLLLLGGGLTTLALKRRTRS